MPHPLLIRYESDDPPGTVQYINPRYIITARYTKNDDAEFWKFALDIDVAAVDKVINITLEGSEALAAKEVLDKVSLSPSM